MWIQWIRIRIRIRNTASQESKAEDPIHFVPGPYGPRIGKSYPDPISLWWTANKALLNKDT
jgi:hypothetical protein